MSEEIWACSKCTFHNSLRKKMCEMCRAKRPIKTIKPISSILSKDIKDQNLNTESKNINISPIETRSKTDREVEPLSAQLKETLSNISNNNMQTKTDINNVNNEANINKPEDMKSPLTFISSLFQTGSGSNIRISNSILNQQSHKFGLDLEKSSIDSEIKKTRNEKLSVIPQFISPCSTIEVDRNSGRNNKILAQNSTLRQPLHKDINSDCLSPLNPLTFNDQTNSKHVDNTQSKNSITPIKFLSSPLQPAIGIEQTFNLNKPNTVESGPTNSIKNTASHVIPLGLIPKTNINKVKSLRTPFLLPGQRHFIPPRELKTKGTDGSTLHGHNENSKTTVGSVLSELNLPECYFSGKMESVSLPPLSIEKIRKFCFPILSLTSQLHSLFNITSGDSFITPAHYLNALGTLGAKCSFCTEMWIKTQITFILWKMVGAQLKYGSTNSYSKNMEKGIFFHPVVVLEQLLIRYNKEYINGERSWLRKIYEGDVSSTSPFISFISEITSTNNIKISDGWYEMNAKINGPYQDVKLTLGQKIITVNATLSENNAYPPLEAPTNLFMNIFTNSCSFAHPDSKLGYTGHIFNIPSKYIHPLGGPIVFFSGIVQTIFPLVYWKNEPNNIRTLHNKYSYDQEINSIEHMREYNTTEAENHYERTNIPCFSAIQTILFKCCVSQELVMIQFFSDNNQENIFEGKCYQVNHLLPAKNCILREPFPNAKLLNSSRNSRIKHLPEVSLKTSNTAGSVQLSTLENKNGRLFVNIACLICEVVLIGHHEQRIIIMDESKFIFGIIFHYPNKGAKRIQLPLLEQGQIIHFKNLIFNYFDSTTASYNFASLTSCEYTQIFKNSSNSNLDAIRNEIKDKSSNSSVLQCMNEFIQNSKTELILNNPKTTNIFKGTELPLLESPYNPINSNKAISTIKPRSSFHLSTDSKVNCSVYSIDTKNRNSENLVRKSNVLDSDTTSVISDKYTHHFGNFDIASMELKVSVPQFGPTGLFALNLSDDYFMFAKNHIDCRRYKSENKGFVSASVILRFLTGPILLCPSVIAIPSSAFLLIWNMTELNKFSAKCAITIAPELHESRTRAVANDDLTLQDDGYNILVRSVVISETIWKEARDEENLIEYLDTLQRWNVSFVESYSVLWWHYEEWEEVLQTIRSNLYNHLFKITVHEETGIVTQCYPLCSNVNINNLFKA